MLRLFTNRGCWELWKGGHFVASCVTKRQVTSFHPVRSTGHHRLHIPARHFNTGNPMWKDAVQPEGDNTAETQTLDLDKWKSVMRAQAAAKEKEVNNEEKASDDNDDDDDDDDDDLKEPGGDLKDRSSLEATRDLVKMWRCAGKLVPEEITDEELQTLAEFTTKSSRKKYLKYLAIKEGHKRNRRKKQQQKAAKRAALREETQNDERSELKNTFFLQIWDKTIDKQLGWRTAQAMRFGQPLVYDMSYESNMSRRDLENAVSQLLEVEGCNRRATEPFHLHFCNLQADGAYQKELLKRYGAEVWDRLLITSTDQQHVDLFPRQQLVYLTADSPNVLRTYDHSKVYIIGAIVDRTIQSGLSLANAKRLNLATARLPLDEYLQWEIGAKNLTLDQMLRIMLTVKETGKWEDALMFVPKRKYDCFYHEQAQKENTKEPRPYGDRLSRSGEEKRERRFQREGQSLYTSQKQFGFSGRDGMAGLHSGRENKPAVTRIRTSFKSNMDGRKSAGRGKMLWEEE